MLPCSYSLPFWQATAPIIESSHRKYIAAIRGLKILQNWLTYRKKIQVTIWKIMHLSCVERCEDMTDHRSYTHNWSTCKIKAWNNSGQNGIRTNDLCGARAVLYQLSYQAHWELVTLWVRNTHRWWRIERLSGFCNATIISQLTVSFYFEIK